MREKYYQKLSILAKIFWGYPQNREVIMKKLRVQTLSLQIEEAKRLSAMDINVATMLVEKNIIFLKIKFWKINSNFSNKSK